MKYFFGWVILCSITFNSCNSKSEPETQLPNMNDTNRVKIKVSTAWIERIRSFDYSRNTKQLLKEFNGFLKTDTLQNENANHIDEDYGRVINPIFVDLDAEPGEELICLLGWDYSSSSLCVFKKLEGDWYLLYKEQIDTFYSAPSLAIAANFSKNKTFYLDRVIQHGSDIFGNEYIFYKLIDKRVYRVLNLLNETYIYGWGLFMNQHIKTKFSFQSDEQDAIGVRYDYNFFPGAINDGDCAWCGNEDVSLIKGDEGVNYVWDAKQLKYKFDAPKHVGDINELNEQKIKCFGDFGNDSLFVIAFKEQINLILKEGSPQQKQIFKQYLELVKSDKTATIAKLTETGKIGGTTFYK